MLMKYVLALICFVLLGFGQVARADSWALPDTEVYLAADGSTRLTVTPRELTNQLDFFEGKVAGSALAGQDPMSPIKAPQAVLEVKDSSGNWTALWKGELVNDVAPVSVLVAPAGRYFVTFDNWHSMGYGDDVVVIYRSDGTIVRKMGLTDFLSKSHVRAMPRSVSSLQWRTEASLSPDGTKLIIPINLPSTRASPEPSPVTYQFILETGAVVPIEPTTLAQIDELASVSLAEDKAAEQARFEFLTEPLVKPADPSQLYDYLQEAYRRLTPFRDPDAELLLLSDEEEESLLPVSEMRPPETAWTFVLKQPPTKDYARSLRSLKELLKEREGDELGEAVAIGSADEANLIQVLQDYAKRLKPGVYKNVYLFVAVSDELWPAIVQSFALSGARLTQIDTRDTIPQNPEWTAFFQKGREQAEAEEAIE